MSTYYVEHNHVPEGEGVYATLAEIKELILGLDGYSRDGLAILEGGREIVVGGGDDGKVVAYYTDDSWVFHNLVGDPEATGVTMLNAYGQPGDYSNREVVSADDAANAVIELLREAESKYTWEES